MATTIAKQDRIGARVPREVYETLCRAAELTGATVNQFLVQSALKADNSEFVKGRLQFLDELEQ